MIAAVLRKMLVGGINFTEHDDDARGVPLTIESTLPCPALAAPSFGQKGSRVLIILAGRSGRVST